MELALDESNRETGPSHSGGETSAKGLLGGFDTPILCELGPVLSVTGFDEESAMDCCCVHRLTWIGDRNILGIHDVRALPATKTYWE